MLNIRVSGSGSLCGDSWVRKAMLILCERPPRLEDMVQVGCRRDVCGRGGVMVEGRSWQKVDWDELGLWSFILR